MSIVDNWKCHPIWIELLQIWRKNTSVWCTVSTVSTVVGRTHQGEQQSSACKHARWNRRLLLIVATACFVGNEERSISCVLRWQWVYLDLANREMLSRMYFCWFVCKLKFMQHCHKLEHDVTGRHNDYNARPSDVLLAWPHRGWGQSINKSAHAKL